MLLHLVHETVSQIVNTVSDVPDPGNGSAPPGFEKFTAVMGWVKWVALGVAVIGIIVIGAKLTIGANRGEGGQHLGALGTAMVGVIVIAGAASLVGFLVN